MSLKRTEVDPACIASDDGFCISFRPAEGPLPGVREFGILQPPILYSCEAGLLVISGLRRVGAARHAGIGRLEVLLYTGDPAGAAMLGLTDRLSGGPLNDVERARCVRCFRRAGWTPQEISRRLAPLLGMRLSAMALEELGALLQMPRSVQELTASGGMRLHTAFRLLRWRPEEERLAGWFAALRLGVNRQRELLDLLDDLAVDGAARGALLRELEEIRASRASGVYEAWLDLLRARRYPRLTAVQRAFEEECARLDLPGGMQLRPPPGFEEPCYRLSLQFASSRELRQGALRLLEAADSPEMEALFRLI